MDYPRYDPQSAVTPLTAAELDSLDHLLAHLPADEAMSLDGLDGYLTALLAGPPGLLAALPSAEWLPVVWGGDAGAGPAPFQSTRQRKATVVLVLRHLRHLNEQLFQSPAEWEPIFSLAEQGTQEWADARDWCAGFLQAVDLLPSPWAGCWEDAALAPLLAPVLTLGGGVDSATAAAEPGSLEEIDSLSRAVPEAVLALLARHHGSPGKPPLAP